MPPLAPPADAHEHVLTSMGKYGVFVSMIEKLRKYKKKASTHKIGTHSDN